MAAQGSQLTNKYAEGYPASATTAAASTSTSPSNWPSTASSRSSAPTPPTCSRTAAPQANEAVLLAFLKPGDTIMGMSLAEGGHLTHGMPLNMSGKWFNVVSYGLDANEAIDYDAMEAQGARAHAQADHRRAPRPTRCASTSSASPRWPRTSARSSWSTWPTTPA
jgi:glycine hydroxymethyltransferase